MQQLLLLSAPERQARKRIDIVSIRMVRDSSVLYPVRQINSPCDAARVFRQFIGDADREQFVVCNLDVKNQPLSLHIASVGTVSSSLVHPREVFKAALLSNASSVVLGHNHPSGDPTPSREDREVTKRLVEAGRLVGIEVLDHVILGGERHVSLREEGVI